MTLSIASLRGALSAAGAALAAAAACGCSDAPVCALHVVSRTATTITDASGGARLFSAQPDGDAILLVELSGNAVAVSELSADLSHAGAPQNVFLGRPEPNQVDLTGFSMLTGASRAALLTTFGCRFELVNADNTPATTAQSLGHHGCFWLEADPAGFAFFRTPNESAAGPLDRVTIDGDGNVLGAVEILSSRKQAPVSYARLDDGSEVIAVRSQMPQELFVALGAADGTPTNSHVGIDIEGQAAISEVVQLVSTGESALIIHRAGLMDGGVRITAQRVNSDGLLGSVVEIDRVKRLDDLKTVSLVGGAAIAYSKQGSAAGSEDITLVQLDADGNQVGDKATLAGPQSPGLALTPTSTGVALLFQGVVHFAETGIFGYSLDCD
jgi:hypothetical protein